MSNPVLRWLVPALVASVVLAGCGGPQSRAAEPAQAPGITLPPSGTTVRVGAAPEGIVYDARTGTLAVAVQAPDRLLLLDPTTLGVRGSVPLPAAVRHLQLAGPGGPVLVPCQDADRLVQVGLPSGRVVASTAVQSHPHDATSAADLIVVGNEFGHSLSVIRGGHVVRTIGGVDQPGGLAPAGDLVAVVDVASFTVGLYDPVSGRRLAVAPAGSGPTHVASTGAGALLVVDTRGNQLIEYSATTLHRVATLPLAGSPYGIVVDPVAKLAWVTLTGDNEVVAVDVSGRAIRVVARYPTVRQPDSVAVAPGSHRVWVTGTTGGEVQRIVR